MAVPRHVVIGRGPENAGKHRHVVSAGLDYLGKENTQLRHNASQDLSVRMDKDLYDSDNADARAWISIFTIPVLRSIATVCYLPPPQTPTIMIITLLNPTKTPKIYLNLVPILQEPQKWGLQSL